eukprot:Polyplicarium_translucidae@DN3051_c7_g1_i1.p2
MNARVVRTRILKRTKGGRRMGARCVPDKQSGDDHPEPRPANGPTTHALQHVHHRDEGHQRSEAQSEKIGLNDPAQCPPSRRNRAHHKAARMSISVKESMTLASNFGVS